MKLTHRFARIPAALLALCMLLSVLCTLPLPITAASGAFSQWKTDGWTESTEDGTPVLTANANQSINVLYLNGVAEGNNLSFSIRMNDSYGTVDGNIGAAYKCATGDQYFFEYNTVAKIVRVRRLGTDGSDNHVGSARSLTLDVGRWYAFDIHFENGLLIWKIDGEEVHRIADTGSDSFTGGSVYIQSYNATAAVKNTVIESEEIEVVEKQSYDFEFKTAESVKGFTADAGAVAWKNGKLVYTLSGAGTRLTSPAINVDPGNAYAALLPLRNTIFVRLKNDTDATRVRVYYTTLSSTKYSEDKSAVFDVEPHSDFTSYFFNLSDCPTVAGGYLYGFAIEPVGATGGTMELDAVTFEREAVAAPFVGTVTACTATNDTVTIRGTLDPAYAGGKVTLYETQPENYSETLKAAEAIAEVTADGTSFTIKVPFENAGVTRLSSLFLIGVNGQRLGSRFTVSNYEDFTDNPYAFDLPDYSVRVTDAAFGARGDAFTNDTAAIQAAIDHVSGKGGGRVVIPGDDSRYGRRYVVTNILLKDNVDLHIEEGAILWQSPRAEDYDYDVLPGHDISIPGVNWTHTASCHNMPLIQGREVKNIKVTGSGLLRMADTGSENADSVSPTTIWTGCEGRIHVTPIGLWKCENIELSGIGLRRTNNYHINLRTCNRAYVADITMWEVTCASGDGISVTIGSKNVVVDRCFFYSNDDAVTICSTYNDPRGLAWWFANPGGDNCIDNLTVRHSNLYGGHGITFITWGTDAPDLSLQEIKNIEVYDCVLSGGTSAVGSWPDNPYYGGTYTNTATDDYSPVKNVRLHDNRYRGKTTIDCIKATNFISDCNIRSATDFEYGNFERGDRRNRTWVSGLSNWSYLTVKGELLDEPVNVSVVEEGTNKHYATIQSDGILCQGLFMSKGEHVFTVDTRFAKGDAALVVINAATGETVAEQALTASSDFEKQTLTFTCERSVTAYLGVRYKGSDGLDMDNAKVTSETFKPDTYFTEDFSDPDTLQITNDGFTLRVEDGSSAAVVPAGQSGLMMMQTPSSYKEFDLHFRLRYDACLSTVDANFGISFFRADSSSQYNMNYNPVYHYIMARSFSGGAQTVIKQFDGDFETGKWMDMAVRVQNGQCLWYIDGELFLSYEVEDRAAAPIALVAYNINCAIKDLKIAPAGTTLITGDEVIPEETEPEETKPPETEPEETTPEETEPEETQPDESQPEETDPDSAPVVEADPETPADTAPATEKPDDGEGCASTVGVGALLSVTVTAAAMTARRKRKETTE